MPKNALTVRFREGEFTAQIDGQPKVWEKGATAEEAVGKLVLRHGFKLNVDTSLDPTAVEAMPKKDRKRLPVPLTERLKQLVPKACNEARSHDPEIVLPRIDNALEPDEAQAAEKFLNWLRASGEKFIAFPPLNIAHLWATWQEQAQDAN